MKTDPIYVWILAPVYNDWSSLKILLSKIDAIARAMPATCFQYLAVDDASPLRSQGTDFPVPLKLLRLRRNMSHQRAISIGLSYLCERAGKLDCVIVMDADGEDDPAAIPLLLEKHLEDPGKIIFASRKKRMESLAFRLGYFFYKALFYLLTGKRISFGNFSLLPAALLPGVVNTSEIWNHYSGAILKDNLPHLTLPVDRQKRYSGKSSMNLQSLLVHGLRSISVYLDRVAARMILFFLFLSLVFGLGIAGVLYFKFFTHLAIPGWTTTALSGLLILLFQALIGTLFLSFIVLGQNTQRLVIPAIHYMDYTDPMHLPDVGHPGKNMQDHAEDKI